MEQPEDPTVLIEYITTMQERTSAARGAFESQLDTLRAGLDPSQAYSAQSSHGDHHIAVDSPDATHVSAVVTNGEQQLTEYDYNDGHLTIRHHTPEGATEAPVGPQDEGVGQWQQATRILIRHGNRIIEEELT
jgi:hypothetical protein